MVYLGTIQVLNGSSVNNTTTGGTTFTISLVYKYLLLVTPSDAGVTYYISVDTGATLAATTNDYSVGISTSVQVKCPNGATANTVVAIRGAGGTGNVRVIGLYGVTQS